MLGRMAPVKTDVSVEGIASNIRMRNIGKMEKR
jgi:hypothetical protein